MSIINLKINELAVERFNDNNSKFAEFMGTSEANIRNYRSKTEPKSEFIRKLVQKLETSYEFLYGEISNTSNSNQNVSNENAQDFTKNAILNADLDNKDNINSSEKQNFFLLKEIILQKDEQIKEKDLQIGKMQVQIDKMQEQISKLIDKLN